MKPLKIFIIAGEASGDIIGSRLIEELRMLSILPIDFYGVGGPKMASNGLQSMFHYEELSVIGFVEIIPHIPNILQRIDQVVGAILSIKPDVVITIDSPGFNFRVAKKLVNSGIKTVHYVAPSVWAYKPERAKKMVELCGHLLALLPFETPYFDKVGLPCTFVGHPLVEQKMSGGNGNYFRKYHGIKSSTPLLCLTPGSRPGEIDRLLPIFGKTVNLLQKEIPNLNVIVLSVDNYLYRIKQETEKWKARTMVLMSSSQQKRDALAACNVALAKSGSGTLELAIAGLPMIVTYKVNPISAWMIKQKIKIRFVNLINIILDEPVIPELLQEKCNPKALAASLKELINNEEKSLQQLVKVNDALQKMRYGARPSPSAKAAKVVMDVIKRKNK